ncbi:signal peptidase I [Actinopolyspora erythraea]|uniref:Signal peptidase I n=1 Tax=Actinopolyspora erythraea TaxID=414996 RepID=A0A223RTD0_9ACTN|nr:MULTISPECIES: hypothetical protein [unclassified Actinopolyspora]ASU79111.1 signal peptidase I [Actinopolyspora erythraea]NHD17737.1 signal peptidase I [Actinopolyspora sp. BKK2]NHE76530.1 signal peptidase I [Actinopolyspora sp. BKK1]
MGTNWHSGNASDDGQDTRGWLLGHFIDPPEDVRATEALEVKWGHHASGEKRSGWTADDQRTTLLLLVQGRFRLELTEGSFTLERQGDYVVWGAGIDHFWEALTDSVVITVRWPSST